MEAGPTSPYTIFSIGDSAVTIDLGNRIAESLNRKVIAMQDWLHKNPFVGLTDVVIAYSSLSVLYDPALVKLTGKPAESVFTCISEKLIAAYTESSVTETREKLIYLPVCYDPSMGPDLELVAVEKQLGTGEVIALHSGRDYRVYMIGFLPGFPYMAAVDERIATGRRNKPRGNVPAGSVGIAGFQTGVYPMESPGGWQIIGRTPVRLFDKANASSLRVKAGDKVQFYPVSLGTYEKLIKFKSPIAYY